jgi:hypothetical protein
MMTSTHIASAAWIIAATLTGIMTESSWAAIIAAAFIIRAGLEKEQE